MSISEANRDVDMKIRAVIGKIELPFSENSADISEFQVKNNASRSTRSRPRYCVPALMPPPDHVETDVTFSLRARPRGREIELDERTDEDGNGNYGDHCVLEQLEFCEEMMEYVDLPKFSNHVQESCHTKINTKLLRGALSEDELSDSDTDTEDEHELPLSSTEKVLNKRDCTDMFQDVRIGSPTSTDLFRVKFRSKGSVSDCNHNNSTQNEEEDEEEQVSKIDRQESLQAVRARLIKKAREKVTHSLMQSVEGFVISCTEEREYKIREQLRSCFENNSVVIDDDKS